MRINKFKKISSNKYKIFFDTKTLTLYEDVILKYNLLYKKEIDSDLLIEINNDNYKASIYDLALKYISIRMRSEKEIREYLLKKNYDIKDVNNTVNRLLNENLINDKLFCKSYVNDKLNLTSSGLDKIKVELERLDIKEEYINEALNSIDKSIIIDKLNNIIDKELKLNTKVPITKLKNKIISRCINLGYRYEDIINILEDKKITSKSNIKGDYDSLYKKYSSKYTGYKLDTFIKSKLYQKGYSFDEINSLFNN